MSDQPFQVNLSRPGPSPSWGFRLQGGCDFSTALSIQSVNPGSLAEQSGLRAGDSILQIGNRSTQDLEHDQAKQEIVNSGNNVFLVVQRGSVKVWQPKVTPLADLRSGPSSVPSQGPTADQYVQRTSLAADKQEPMKINFFNKSPRGFPGAGGGNSAPSAANNQAKPTVPVIMNAQYNTPMNMYSSNSAMEAFDQQSQALVGNMDGLSVKDEHDGNSIETNNNQTTPTVKITTTLAADDATFPAKSRLVQLEADDPAAVRIPKRVASPTLLAVHDQDESATNKPRSQSPSFMRVLNQHDDQQSVQRSVSPTLLAIQEQESGQKNLKPAQKESVIYQDRKEGEEMRYRGFKNPSTQSRSFRLLQQELSDPHADGQQGAPAEPSQPSGGGGVQGMRSVRAPTGPPANVKIQQAQTMTCKACGTLIVGVFVRIKGDPLHPECFKCANCGKNLKNQGHFTVQGSLFCEVCVNA